MFAFLFLVPYKAEFWNESTNRPAQWWWRECLWRRTSLLNKAREAPFGNLIGCQWQNVPCGSCFIEVAFSRSMRSCGEYFLACDSYVKASTEWSLPGFNLCSFYFLFLADPPANLGALRPFFLAKDEPAVAQRANNNNGHFYGAWSLARSRAQGAVQKAAEKCINTYNGQNKKGFGPYDRQPRKNLHTAILVNKPKSVTKHDDNNTMMDERSLESCVWVRFPDGFPHEAWAAVSLHQPQRFRGSNPRCPNHKSGALVEWCFTSTETVGLLGTGAQDGHLDFLTAPKLCPAVLPLS